MPAPADVTAEASMLFETEPTDLLVTGANDAAPPEPVADSFPSVRLWAMKSMVAQST